jgi:hypothetical protein
MRRLGGRRFRLCDAMARVGIEPTTPRFSGDRANREERCDLQGEDHPPRLGRSPCFRGVSGCLRVTRWGAVTQSSERPKESFRLKRISKTPLPSASVESLTRCRCGPGVEGVAVEIGGKPLANVVRTYRGRGFLCAGGRSTSSVPFPVVRSGCFLAKSRATAIYGPV